MPAPSEPTRPSLRQVALFLSLFALTIVRPFLGERILGIDPIRLSLIVALVTGVLCSARTRRDWILLTTAAGAALASLLVPLTSDAAQAGAISLLLLLVFFAMVGLQMVKILLRPTRGVSPDTILAAATTYLVLGTAWALAFSVLEFLEPGSFDFPFDGPDPEPETVFARLFGFSFTTLTTLGYGNIAPATARADALANSEAMAGQAYLAIVVARLVGLHMAASMGPSGPADEPRD